MKKLVIVFIIISYITLAATVYYLFQQNQRAATLITSSNNTPVMPVKKEINIPNDAVKISECVPNMGEHWVRPADIPAGPYYVVNKGKVVGLEYMFKSEDIPGEKAAKLAFPDFLKYLKTNNYSLQDYVKVNEKIYSLLKGYEYESIHIAWTAPHAGFTVPHIDMHIFLIPQDQIDAICPNVTLDQVDSPDVLKTLKENNIPYPGGP